MIGLTWGELRATELFFVFHMFWSFHRLKHLWCCRAAIIAKTCFLHVLGQDCWHLCCRSNTDRSMCLGIWTFCYWQFSMDWHQRVNREGHNILTKRFHSEPPQVVRFCEKRINLFICFSLHEHFGKCEPSYGRWLDVNLSEGEFPLWRLLADSPAAAHPASLSVDVYISKHVGCWLLHIASFHHFTFSHRIALASQGAKTKIAQVGMWDVGRGRHAVILMLWYAMYTLTYMYIIHNSCCFGKHHFGMRVL